MDVTTIDHLQKVQNVVSVDNELADSNALPYFVGLQISNRDQNNLSHLANIGMLYGQSI